MDDRLDAAAALLVAGRRERRTLDAADHLVALSLPDAYEVQRRVTGHRLARGERIVGWKLGYTSIAMRAQMGIAEPNHGPLTDAMLIADGGTVGEELIQPRVEPEIALLFARELTASGPAPTRNDVLDALEGAYACLEVVDSVWTDYRFDIAHNTADGSSAAGVVIGPRLPTADLAAVEVVLEVDASAVAVGRGADASGHPADGVLWLLERLAPAGLRAGDVVITGGLTSSVALGPGECVSARFAGGGIDASVEVSVTRADR